MLYMIQPLAPRKLCKTNFPKSQPHSKMEHIRCEEILEKFHSILAIEQPKRKFISSVASPHNALVFYLMNSHSEVDFYTPNLPKERLLHYKQQCHPKSNKSLLLRQILLIKPNKTSSSLSLFHKISPELLSYIVLLPIPFQSNPSSLFLPSFGKMLLVVTNILTDVNSLGSDREQGGPKPGPKFD